MPTAKREIGIFRRGESKGQEIWKVHDESFSHLIIARDNEEQLRFITAVAREDGDAKRVPYSAAADWQVPRQAGDPKINNFANTEQSFPGIELFGREWPRSQLVTPRRDPLLAIHAASSGVIGAVCRLTERCKPRRALHPSSRSCRERSRCIYPVRVTTESRIPCRLPAPMP